MFRSWWQKAKKPLGVVGFITVLVVAITLIFVEVRLYGSGFAGKTLWEWLQLLIIPAVLALGGYLFTYTTSRNERAATEKRTQAEREAAEKRAQAERDISLDNQREAALQVYIDKISELLLRENLRKSEEDAEVRTIARVRTSTVLSELDGRRKGNLIQFLYESGLISEKEKFVELECVIDLDGANLSKANLRDTILQKVIFRRTNLSEADLQGCLLSDANLFDADLHRANLNKADLSGVCLIKADLRGAVLIGALMLGANLTKADLRKANLSGAYLGKIADYGVISLECDSSANLNEADLRKAILEKTDLTEACLMNANLSEAILTGANLNRADLSLANLSGAKVTTEQLDQVRSLKGATMPDGSKHP